MSYWDIAEMSRDADLVARITACVAQEIENSEGMVTQYFLLDICASPGWSEAWASAVAAELPNPGRDPGVITDGMILSAVQAIGA